MSEAPPHDLSAEEAVIGNLIVGVYDTAFEEVNQLVAEDFYAPLHQQVFEVALKLHANGERVDVMTVRDELRRQGEEVDRIVLMDLATAAGGATRRYADTVANHSLSRRLIRCTRSIASAARLPGANAADVLDNARAELAAINAPVGEVPSDLHTLDDFLDRPAGAKRRWVVNGLLRVGWRTMVVAGEGVGKSQLFRQFAVLSAQGIHPLRFYDIPPVRTLLVDLENPEDAIASTCEPIRDQVLRQVGVADYEPGRAWLWHHPAGINLRTRADRVAFERVIAATRPELVCLGPIYKAYRVAARENDELAAAEVQCVLDDLRNRYGFALLVEHHAPKEQDGERRMMPYGSSLWLRWPEVGIKLTKHGTIEGAVRVGRWRGDRMPTDWPVELHRGLVWPWEGKWDR